MSRKCVSGRLQAVSEADSPCRHCVSDALTDKKSFDIRGPRTTRRSERLLRSITLPVCGDKTDSRRRQKQHHRIFVRAADFRGRQTGGESICQPSFQPPLPSPAWLLPCPACTRVREQLLAPAPQQTHLASVLGAHLCLQVCSYDTEMCVFVSDYIYIK